MENKIEYQATLFENRVAKKYKLLKKWARKNRINCFRIYDRDIPEIPLAVDLYEFLPEHISEKIECALWLKENSALISANDLKTIENTKKRIFAHLYAYEKSNETSEEEFEPWLNAMKKSLAKVLQIPETNVITKIRKKQAGTAQYEKIESEKKIEGRVQECGQIFKINLSEYLDTGLFLDHRPLRAIIRESCAGKSVLNLFSYTGSFSVYAAEGKAARIESVDLSNTYLSWAKENMELNGFFDKKKFFYTRQDVNGFLNQKNAEVENSEGSNRFDLIILDPPTFSNSKATQNILDINRDWADLCAKSLKLLRKNGILYFSSNSKRLPFNEEELKAKVQDFEFDIEDMTEKSIPEDFKGKKIHRCWKIKVK
ncbi:class I SAM-dependent methyltransferase [Treponema pectinovorum]|uniref:class I SAM-dependent methyltransferase n=1 Tax=Treponema pectinovorum TaxID=164 RepID=UPI0011C7D53E|nr:class I SAM-dependent methyltransferase [Treponema pectinovorum]